jgi:hypothetical protein
MSVPKRWRHARVAGVSTQTERGRPVTKLVSLGIDASSFQQLIRF